MSSRQVLQNCFKAIFFLQLASVGLAFQNQILQAYPPYVPSDQGYYVPQSPPNSPSWTSTNNGGVPTWIITTTEIETRNETTNEEDKIQEPNVKETDAMMSSDEEDESDLEFPVVHGKDPAVHARPAFSEVDKYEEDQAAEEQGVNKTKTTITVNRTTVVKIEFVNSAFIPMVLQVGSLKDSGKTHQTKKNDTLVNDTNYSTKKQAEEATNQNGGQSEQGQASNRNEQIDKTTTNTNLTPHQIPVQPNQIIPGTPVSFSSGWQLPTPQVSIPQFYYPTPYARYWKRK